MKTIVSKLGSLLALVVMIVSNGCGGDNTITIGAVELKLTSPPPSSIQAGESFSFTVAAVDGSGNPFTDFDGLITVTFDSPEGPITITGSGQVFASNGEATFMVDSINIAQTLSFSISAADLEGLANLQVMVEPGDPFELAYVTGMEPPSTAIVDQTWDPFAVEVLDSFGNRVTDAGGSITVGKLGMSGGMFTGDTVALSSGVALFDGLSYDAIESVDLDLSTTLTGIMQEPASESVDVQCGVAGVATQLVFGNMVAANQTAGTAWNDGTNADFTLEIRDCFGDAVATDNTTMVSASVTSGASFTGGSTTTEQAASGIVTFDNLVQTTAGDVVLDFTTASLPDITDVMVTVGPDAVNSLTFTGQPSMGQDLQATSTMTVTVRARDQYNNDVPGETIGLAIGNDPSAGATLRGTTSASTNSSGVASFGGVGLNLVGTGYTLEASHTPTMTTQESPSFNITPGPPDTISFNMAAGGSHPPANTTTDSSDDFSAGVGIVDQYGNNVADGTLVTLSLTGGTFNDTPTLETDQSMHQQTTTNGVATWTGINVTKVGTGAMLQVTYGMSLSANSNPFNVNHGAADHLDFGTAPTSPATDTVQWEDFTVEVLDANDNVVSSNSTNTVSVSETASGTLSGTLSRSLDSGVATFNDLVFTLADSGMQEVVSLDFSSDLMSVSETAVDGTSVTVETGPVPAQVAYYANTSGMFSFGDTNIGSGDTVTERVNQTWAPIILEIQDTMGERAFTDSSTIVTLSLPAGTGSFTGSTSRTADKGVVIFDDLSYDTVEGPFDIQIDNLAMPMLDNPRDAMGFVPPQVQIVDSADVGLDIERVSLDDMSNPYDCDSNPCAREPSVSADGRFVAFRSIVMLVTSETNVGNDIFVRDRVDDTTELISTDESGSQSSFRTNTLPSISANGRFVAFVTDDEELINASGDPQVVVKDRATAELVVASQPVGDFPVPSDGENYYPAISGDGRYVAFASNSTDLVDGLSDSDGFFDVFVRDLALGTTELVSVDTGGGLPNGHSGVRTSVVSGAFVDPDTLSNARPISISADGRYVAFESFASDLVSSPADTNLASDIYVRDRVSGITIRASLSVGGAQTGVGQSSLHPDISDDGRYVAFNSASPSLVTGDNNSADDVFVRDTVGSTTVRVSVSDAGVEGDERSARASISADGRYVAFESDDLSAFVESTLGTTHIFVHDRDSDEDGTFDEAGAIRTYQADRAADGTVSNQASKVAGAPSLSANGAYVAFQSDADDLISGDTNLDTDIFIAPVLHDFVMFVTGGTAVPGATFDGTADGNERFNSITEADAICNDIGVTTFGAGTAWVAWLSTTSEDARDHLQNELNAFGKGGRWYQTGASPALIAPGVATFSSGALNNAVERDENGAAAGTYVFTGTQSDGTAATQTCSDWSDSGGLTERGITTAADNEWTDDNAGLSACGNNQRIYCIQTD